ncbi:hypothetical protein BJX66DRAFT_334397 [Aspergillus keveii]|uniref:Secreted protein n=1 Tax=Aspergillus keveii TaxID=714993 RepID=A0ABR4GGA9_9EURO
MVAVQAQSVAFLAASLPVLSPGARRGRASDHAPALACAPIGGSSRGHELSETDLRSLPPTLPPTKPKLPQKRQVPLRMSSTSPLTPPRAWAYEFVVVSRRS